MTHPEPVLDAAAIRRDFPILDQASGSEPFIFLDSAATTLKPRQVIDAVTEYYAAYSSNVHRGIYKIAERATAEYEAVREKTARFINAPETSGIVFTSGATESINLAAYSWARRNLSPGDEILITEMEHHSNLVPWQLAAQDTGAALKYIPILEDGTLDREKLDELLNPKVKLLCLTHQSNVLGTVNPVADIAAKAHDAGALVLVDASQSVPHFPVDVQALDCDFMAFSGHKMLGPTGVGVLYARPELLEAMPPFLGGGEMIRSVSMESSVWNDIPFKFEAGTPNVAQVIGLGSAIDYLSNIGMEKVARCEQKLRDYATDRLAEIPGLRIYGNAPRRGAVLSFDLDGIHPHDIAQMLSEYGVAVRAGHHCAQPIMKRYQVSSTTRASFYIYNTFEEADQLCDAIRKVQRFWGV